MKQPFALRGDAVSRWIRGGHWVIHEHQTTNKKTWIEVLREDATLQEYDPITQGTDAYLAFARLREEIWSPEPNGPRLESMVRFAEEYGPPMYEETWDWHQWHEGNRELVVADQIPVDYWAMRRGERLRIYAFDVDLALHEATLLAIAIRCYQSVSQDWPRFQPDLKAFLNGPEGKELMDDMDDTYEDRKPWAPPSRNFDDRSVIWEFLHNLMNKYPESLQGVYPTLTHDSGLDWWVPSFDYKNLLSVMWMQLLQAILDHSVIQNCEGCGVLFQATRRNQSYHDSYCRASANARRTYWRRKGSLQV